MIGEILQDRYRLDTELGQGGMGILYKAHDLLLKREVAIKLLNETGLGSQGRQRLLHEAQAAAQLDHPNIVTVFDVSEASGRPFLVMQLVDGVSLQELHPTDFDQILSIMLQVCAALEHAHAHGVIHRDLKPENVLVTPQGTALLTDFGLARSVASRFSAEGMFIGTVFYMAPEQTLGEEVDDRADLYALGVMLYELTAGRLPFIADDPISVITQHLYAPVVPPSTYNQLIPDELDRLILRLMSKSPAERPASAAETARLLESINQNRSEAVMPPPALSSGSILARIARGRLVGRQVELARLQELWAYVQQGHAHMALISGEPGVGKTRLAHEFIVYAQLNHAVVLRGGCYEFEATTPYLPISEALRDWAGRQSIDALRSLHESTAFELSRLAPEIEIQIGPLPPNPVLPPNEERLRMFDHIARFLQKQAASRGLLIFIDDLHWADNGTIALLHFLLRRLREERLLILAAYREVELDRSRPLSNALVDWNRERLATRMAIGRLTLDSCRAMLAGLFGLETISEEFNELVYHDTEGNPFFIEEVIRSLIEQGQIYREEDRWERKEIAELTIPQSVREAIGRRLNRLSEACIDVLHIAAAIGKTFEFRELTAVTDIDEEVLIDALDEASQAQVIYSDKAEAFTFTHDKIREVLYEELNPIRRRRLHKRIGEGLTALYDPEFDAHVQELAYHFIESGDLEKGMLFARRAAALSEKIFAHDEAIYYYTRAAECAEALDLPEQLIEIEEASGDVYYRTGPFEKAVEYYQRALDLAPTPAKRAELNIRIGATYALIGDERGLEYLTSALDQLDPEQIEARARALAMIGRFHHYHGHGEEALSYLEKARHLAEPLDNTELLTEVYSYLTGAHQWWGDINDSNAWARRTLEFGESRQAMSAVALGYEFLSENATITGRWQEAIEYADRNRTIGEKIGSFERMAWADMSTTFAYHNLGNLIQALRTADHGILLSDRVGDGRLELIMHTERAKLAADLDDDDMLNSDLAAVEELSKNSSHFQTYEWLYRALCYIYENRRQWEKLMEAVDQYEELTNRSHPEYSISAKIGLRNLAALAELPEKFFLQPDLTENLVERAYHWRLLGRYRVLINEFEAAEGAYTRSIEGFEQAGARLEAGRSIIWRAELYTRNGQEAKAQADFKAAKDIFEACGAKLDLKRIREL